VRIQNLDKAVSMQATKAYGEVEVKFHTFLLSALDEKLVNFTPQPIYSQRNSKK
jgi:hypothetical protein